MQWNLLGIYRLFIDYFDTLRVNLVLPAWGQAGQTNNGFLVCIQIIYKNFAGYLKSL